MTAWSVAGWSVARGSATGWFKGVVVGVAVVGLAATIGCREEEQGRPLSYEKGTYQGAPDAPIDEETRRELRERIQGQSFN